MLDKINKTNIGGEIKVSTDKNIANKDSNSTLSKALAGGEPEVVLSHEQIEQKNFFATSLWEGFKALGKKNLTANDYEQLKKSIEEQYKNNGGDLTKLEKISDEEYSKIFKDGKMNEKEAFNLYLEHGIKVDNVDLGDYRYLQEVTKEKGVYTAKFTNGAEVSFVEHANDKRDYPQIRSFDKYKDPSKNEIYIEHAHVTKVKGTPIDDDVYITDGTVDQYIETAGNDRIKERSMTDFN